MGLADHKRWKQTYPLKATDINQLMDLNTYIVALNCGSLKVCVISVPYNPYNRQIMIITRDFSAVCVSLVDCNTLNRKQVATIEAVVVLCFLCSVWTALYGATNGENIHHGTSVCVCVCVKLSNTWYSFQCSTFVNRWTHWPFASHAGPIWNRQVMQSTLYRSMSTASVPHYF